MHIYMDKNRRSERFVLYLLCVGIVSVMAHPLEAKTYRDYPEWELLPKGVDFEDEAMLAKCQQLADEGEAGHEAMVAIVKECEEPLLARRALGMLRDMGGDMSQPLSELKPFFTEGLSTSRDEWLLTSIARFVADYGTEEDVDVLIPMLANPNWRIRVLGARYLGQSGGQHALDALKQVKQRNADQTLLQEIDKAIANIEKRLADKDAGTEPVP